MNDPIKEVSGIEAKHALAQFIGQNISELKKLDSDIISGNSTLRGLTLNINEVGTDIPTSFQQPQPIPQPTSQYTPPPQVHQPPVIVQTVEVPKSSTHKQTHIEAPIKKEESDQFEFCFKLTPEKIYDKLDSIERQNREIIATQKKILELLERKDRTKRPLGMII